MTGSPHPWGSAYRPAPAPPSGAAPGQRRPYCLCELDCTLYRYHREADGTSASRSALDMLPEGYQGERWGADLHLTPDGRFHTSERASSPLTLFGIDEKDGALTPLGHFPTEACPRGFAIDHGGHWLIATGQQSDQGGGAPHRPESGRLTLASRHEVGKGAMWVRILNLAERPA